MDDFFKIEFLNQRIELIRNSQSEKERYSAQKMECIKNKVGDHLNGGIKKTHI
jgi:hypothetical protein